MQTGSAAEYRTVGNLACCRIPPCVIGEDTSWIGPIADKQSAADSAKFVWFRILTKSARNRRRIVRVFERRCPKTAGCRTTDLCNRLIIQHFPAIVIMIPESQEPPRQIYLDGRALPTDPDPTWLVVQTTGFKEQGWLDNIGHPRGRSMLIIERFHRRDFGHIDLEIRYEDPKYYTRPFANKTTLNLIPIPTSLSSSAPRMKRIWNI